MKQLYVIVDDAEGGAYHDGTFVTINTRVLFDGSNVFGNDNLAQKFTSSQASRLSRSASC
jgi:hypothetical protein